MSPELQTPGPDAFELVLWDCVTLHRFRFPVVPVRVNRNHEHRTRKKTTVLLSGAVELVSSDSRGVTAIPGGTGRLQLQLTAIGRNDATRLGRFPEPSAHVADCGGKKRDQVG